MRGLALGLLLLHGVARAATPTLAVMPLRDLAGGRASVGAALRETLTVDLIGTPGVRVVDRQAIDRVLHEQALDSAHGMEGVVGVRVGTLLGASHLITGAYQRQGGTLRVTVRVIAVETGVVIGSAKIDGELERMLELEDRVSRGLLESVGWKAPTSKPVHPRPRPRLSARSIELFGDAALEPDPEKKKKILHAVVQDSPQFSYAVDALAALEGRLGTYEDVAAAQLDAQERASLAFATDAGKPAAQRLAKIGSILPTMRALRRYHALLAACDALRNAPTEARAEVQFHRFLALEGLRRIDEALAAGEKSMAEAPTSPHFAETETRIRAMAQVRRTMATRRADYDKDLKEKLDDLGKKAHPDADDLVQLDWAPCIAARWNRQYNQLMVDGCRRFVAKHGDAKDDRTAGFAKSGRLFVILALGELGRFDEARREIADFRKRYPAGDDELDAKLAEWPID